MTHSRLTSTLTYAGALPFLLGALWYLLGITTLAQELTQLMLAYGLAIASFMAGTHWGMYLQHDGVSPRNLLITSNAVTLSVWLVYGLGSTIAVLFALLLAFAYLLFIDMTLYRHKVIPDTYYRLRRNVTFIVMISLLGVLSAA